MNARDMHAEMARWIENVTEPDLAAELSRMKEAVETGDESAFTDAFFQDLSFGTAGLRGTLGAGTNRMNIYTVGRATQGFADYLNAHFENPSVAIARDSRNNGELFVRTAAAIFAANGVHAYVYPRISPVPTLSWAVRDLGCSGGVCVTASHNPAAYNGYKAYGPDGCQITSEAAAAISAAIEDTDIFSGVKSVDFDAALAKGDITWIDDTVLERYYDAVLSKSVSDLSADEVAKAPLKLVYSPLNGTGLVPVTTVLERAGVTDITVVPEHRGDVVFLDDDNRYMFDLRHEVRFVNAGEYGSDSPEMFFGFLCGMLAQNFDISVIFVDAFLKLVKTDIENTENFVQRLAELSEKHNVKFVLSVNVDDAVAPEFIKKYFI